MDNENTMLGVDIGWDTAEESEENCNSALEYIKKLQLRVTKPSFQQDLKHATQEAAFTLRHIQKIIHYETLTCPQLMQFINSFQWMVIHEQFNILWCQMVYKQCQALALMYDAIKCIKLDDVIMTQYLQQNQKRYSTLLKSKLWQTIIHHETPTAKLFQLCGLGIGSGTAIYNNQQDSVNNYTIGTHQQARKLMEAICVDAAFKSQYQGHEIFVAQFRKSSFFRGPVFLRYLPQNDHRYFKIVNEWGIDLKVLNNGHKETFTKATSQLYSECFRKPDGDISQAIKQIKERFQPKQQSHSGNNNTTPNESSTNDTNRNKKAQASPLSFDNHTTSLHSSSSSLSSWSEESDADSTDSEQIVTYHKLRASKSTNKKIKHASNKIRDCASNKNKLNNKNRGNNFDIDLSIDDVEPGHYVKFCGKNKQIKYALVLFTGDNVLTLNVLSQQQSFKTQEVLFKDVTELDILQGAELKSISSKFLPQNKSTRPNKRHRNSNDEQSINKNNNHNKNNPNHDNPLYVPPKKKSKSNESLNETKNMRHIISDFISKDTKQSYPFNPFCVSSHAVPAKVTLDILLGNTSVISITGSSCHCNLDKVTQQLNLLWQHPGDTLQPSDIQKHQANVTVSQVQKIAKLLIRAHQKWPNGIKYKQTGQEREDLYEHLDVLYQNLKGIIHSDTSLVNLAHQINSANCKLAFSKIAPLLINKIDADGGGIGFNFYRGSLQFEQATNNHYHVITDTYFWARYQRNLFKLNLMTLKHNVYIQKIQYKTSQFWMSASDCINDDGFTNFWAHFPNLMREIIATEKVWSNKLQDHNVAFDVKKFGVYDSIWKYPKWWSCDS